MEEAIKNRDLTEGLIKEFHALLFANIKAFSGGTPVVPGAYKTKDNHVLTISGQIHHYAPATQVPIFMENLIAWYTENKQCLHPIELATIFHHKLVAIHPFTDGNGRVSRLCMNFILMQKGYPPAIIRKEKRKEYYEALESADEGNIGLFVQMLAEEVTHNLNLMVKELGKMA